MNDYETRNLLFVASLLPALAVVRGLAGPPAAGKSAPAAKVDSPKPESDLATVTLSPTRRNISRSRR